MTIVSVVDDLELGDGAEGRPLVWNVREMEYVDESPWRFARAQVDEQPHGARSGDQRDPAGHVLANRVELASDFEGWFGRVMVCHGSAISTG
ncbi:hypothetical protein [Nocardia sp. IFM 10818]